MAIEIFNRIENKFLIDYKQHKAIEKTLRDGMIKDDASKDGAYLIQNIYYDTEDQYLIKYSLSKPVFKEKLRVRAYGLVTMESMVFIELKKKYNGVVNKRRSLIKLCDAYKFLNTKDLPSQETYHNHMVLKEIQQFLFKYDMKPSLYIAYQRDAFKRNDLRVTLDHHIVTRKDDLRLEYGPKGDLLLMPHMYLMEIKSQFGMPIWLTKKLSKEKIYKTSFSKAGKDFIRRERAIEERGIKCLKQSLLIRQKQPLHS